LWDICGSVSEAIEQHKPQLIRLLEEHVDFDRLIPVSFKLAIYRHMGRKHIYYTLNSRKGKGMLVNSFQLPSTRTRPRTTAGTGTVRNCSATSTQKLKTSFGEIEIEIPRDRKVEFGPRLIKKNQTSVSQDVENKIEYGKEYELIDIPINT